MTLYYFFTDFVGPIATVITAGAAFHVTMQLGRRQEKAAESQAATAQNKIRAAMLRLRLDVYGSISNVAQIALYNDGNNQFQIEDLQTSTAKILEAESILSPEIYAIAKDFLDKSHALIAMKSNPALLDNNYPICGAEVAKIDASQAALLVLFRSLSRKFTA